MKIVWTIVALLLLGGLVVVFQPESGARKRDALSAPEAMTAEPAAAPAKPEPKAEPKPEAKPEVKAEPKPEPKPEAKPEPKPEAKPEPKPEPKPAAPVTPAPAPKPDPKPLVDVKPSSEPKPPARDAIAAGSTFNPEIPTIPNAEILPSKFVKLADGSIAADDTWTIRGEGTKDTPYEVSWEFLSSAQENYTPRLGEKKIPARIAFLSGKRVKISGYLAFPLVAPTASECLVMLNQWDGCCIGVPPTPYDAVEIKLAKPMQGWKRHTFNFGAVEGTLKVEPYLVENWLVGLYLMEGSTIDNEL